MRSGAWIAVTAIGLAGCSGSSHGAAAPQPSAVATSPTESATPSPVPIPHVPTASASPTIRTGEPAADGFRPTDVTFITRDEGWAIGRDEIVRTNETGNIWEHAPAPPDNARDLRFATPLTGYAWRPMHQLWMTTDGGNTWHTGGLAQVDALEIAGGNAWALAGPEPYPGVWHSRVGSTTWRKFGLSPDRGATLDVYGSLAYVTGQQGAGPIPPSLDVWSADGTSRHENLPCVRHDVIPWSPLGVSTDGSLVLDCDVEAPHNEHQVFYTSTDEGRSWTTVASPPKLPDDITAVPGSRFAFGQGIYVDNGSGWQQVLAASGARHFRIAGFQDDTHGIALTRHGVLYRTTDAGQTWRPVTV